MAIMFYGCAILVALSGFCSAETSDEDIFTVSEAYDDLAAGPRPLKDRFRIMQPNLTSDALKTEIDDFTSYGCETMVVISNDAHDWLQLWCNSHQDTARKVNLSPGYSFIFTFRPKSNGATQFFCTLDYKGVWARFDVYNGWTSYMCPREIDNVYRYSVRHDGIYANGNNKIRSLFKGHNEYILWEKFDESTNETNGLVFSGLLDGGECADLTSKHNDRTVAVSVCNHQCIYLYEHYGCKGHREIVHAGEDCVDFKLGFLGKKLSALKGC